MAPRKTRPASLPLFLLVACAVLLRFGPSVDTFVGVPGASWKAIGGSAAIDTVGASAGSRAGLGISLQAMPERRPRRPTEADEQYGKPP
eukprot:CAMPEP_0117570760 /NCGR_PEP_ID=MMETSP0784-20121206/59372_1 /TAXON_ID=39447 /ORGANISM="" /LENGTH=88 /DNA_ID=CAMNT_0005368839 /DNA_START=38 /DNA_END=301 /DNA_ORIENTATION=-